MAYPGIGIARLLEDGDVEIAIEIAVPDIAAVIAEYGSDGNIQLQSASSATGSYNDLTTLDLATGTTFYTYTHTAGTVTTWYRYRFEDAAGTAFGAWSDVFRAAPAGQTLQTIRQELAKEMGMYGSGTTTGAGSTSTVVDSSQIVSILNTNAWQGGWLKMTSGDASGQVRRIASYAIATGTFTVTPVFSAASGLGNTWEVYRDLGPSELDEAINDALMLLPVEDEYIFSGDTATNYAGRNEYPLPYWFTDKAQILGLDRVIGWGAVTSERQNQLYEPVLEGSWELRRNVATGYHIKFFHGIGANQTYRLRVLRPYTPIYDLRVTSDSTAITLPMHDVIVASRFQAYDRLVKSAPANAKADEWRTRRNEARAAFHSMMARYYRRSTPLQQPGQTVAVVW